MLSKLIMLLDMYIFTKDQNNAILGSTLSLIIGIILISITVVWFSEYRVIPKENKKKRKKSKIILVILGTLTLICIAINMYFYFYALPKANKENPHNNKSWSDSINENR